MDAFVYVVCKELVYLDFELTHIPHVVTNFHLSQAHDVRFFSLH